MGPAIKLRHAVTEIKQGGDGTSGPAVKKLITPIDSMRKYQEHLERIKCCECDADSLANPTKHLKLPYPYLGPHRPQDRFFWHEDGCFSYQGRKAFKEVLHRVKSMRISGGNGYKELYIQGTMGYGKSHLICALVCYLMKIGERVIYAPDCKSLTADPFKYMRDAFRLAFADSPQIVQMLNQCLDMNALERLAEKIAEFGITMFVFIDQANALDAGSGGRMSSDARAKLMESLSRLSYSHFFIQSTSANFEMAAKALFTQEQVDKLELNGGYDEEEMHVWWKRTLPLFPRFGARFREALEDLSGRNPLLLHGVEKAVCEYKKLQKSKEDEVAEDKNEKEQPAGQENEVEDEEGSADENGVIWRHIYESDEWIDAKSRVESYARDFITGKADTERTWFFDIMENCLINDNVSRAERAVIDNRYFYTTRQNIGHCTSGLVRDTMAAFLRKHAGGDTFLKQQWYNMIEYVGGNSSVLGFFVEQVVLSRIEKEGMTMDGIKIPGMKSVGFRTLPKGPENTDGSPVLYIPDTYNYKAIDGVIISAKIVNDLKVLEIMPMQITINQHHEDSEKSFFEGWDDFVVKILGASDYDDLKITFLWIVEDSETFPREDEFVAANTLTTRNGSYSTPSYERKVRSVKYVSEMVGHKLRMARERGKKKIANEKEKQKVGKRKAGGEKLEKRASSDEVEKRPERSRTRRAKGETKAAKKKASGDKPEKESARKPSSEEAENECEKKTKHAEAEMKAGTKTAKNASSEKYEKEAAMKKKGRKGVKK
ncbi:hypothetical protein BDD12DRAFT_979387 [Trichophaea hybrida]|nr:hypothetical protein BDD12DRAFT_979387 [Trichophaea hybrida]